jgi:hypothetical protein
MRGRSSGEIKDSDTEVNTSCDRSGGGQVTHVSQISHGIVELQPFSSEAFFYAWKAWQLQKQLWPQNCFGGVMTTEDFR